MEMMSLLKFKPFFKTIGLQSQLTGVVAAFLNGLEEEEKESCLVGFLKKV